MPRFLATKGWLIVALGLAGGAIGRAAPWPGEIHLPPFPKANPAQAFSELKIYGPDGSPIRMPKEDWDAARTRVESNAAWRQWLDTRKTEVDAWMASRADHVEWVAGWWHDFVSPKDGSFLTFTPDEPRPLTFSSPSDPAVPLTPKLRAAWIGVFRQKHIEHIVEAARLYRLTGESRYAAWAAGQLDFYADHFAEWPRVNHVGTSQLTYQSLDDAVELTQLVEAARTLDAYVSPERKRRWIDGCFKPDAALLQASFQTIHNIACWCRSAEVQVALYSGDNALWTQAVEGPNGIREQVARGVTSDYLWFEQSLGYNAYVVQALLPCFTNAMRAGRGESLRAEMETVENLMLTPAAMRFPDGHLPNPADSNAIHHAPDRELLARAANLFPTAIGLRQLAGEKSWTALLASSNTAPEAAPLPEVTSRNLESTRMAILRHGPWQVFFHYGQLTASHAQAEALNFEAAFGTTDVSHDPGTVGYGSPMSRDYYRAGVCHNVPLVDGAGQEGWDPGKLERFASQSVSASQPRYRTHAEAARRLEVLGDLLRDTESISVTDGTTHALGFMLNLQGKIHFAAPLAADLSFPDSRPAGFRYFRDATRADFRDQAIFTVDCSGTRFRVTLQLPGAFTLWHVSAPDGPPNRREAVYLETRGTAATLTTTFTPLR